MYFQLVIKNFRRKLHFIIKECLENRLYFRPSQWLPPLKVLRNFSHTKRVQTATWLGCSSVGIEIRCANRGQQPQFASTCVNNLNMIRVRTIYSSVRTITFEHWSRWV